MVVVPPIAATEGAIAIVGWDEGGAGQVHSWIEKTGIPIACFVNPSDDPPAVDVEAERRKRPVRQFDFPTRDSFKGKPLVSASDWPAVVLSAGIRRALVIVGPGEARAAQIERARAAGIELVNAIHPTALVMEDAILEDNVLLHARAFVGYRAEIHRGTSLNTGAQVDHHNVLRECVTIDPGVVTAGNVTIERYAHVHTGATIKNRIRIGERAVVGAGAVVIRDVEPGTVVVGVPAKPLERRT